MKNATAHSGGHQTEQLALFHGDAFYRLQVWLGLSSTESERAVSRTSFFFLTTWITLAALSSLNGVAIGQTTSQSFLLDPMAYAQFLVGLPLFVIAEFLLNDKIEAGVDQFGFTGLIPQTSISTFQESVNQVQHMASSPMIDIILLIIAFASTLSWVIGDMSRGVTSWFMTPRAGGPLHLTAAGWWATIYAVPLFNYWVGRWVIKSILWCVFLWKMSRIRLNLVPSHPDRTGGLGFLSSIQATFGVLVFAFGCIVVANTASRMSHGISIESFTTWAPILIFVFVAPIAFLLPLLFFSRQLSRAKSRRLAQYSKASLSFGHALTVQISEDSKGKYDESKLGECWDKGEIINTIFRRTARMRVVPFDFRSTSQLAASALAPVIPLALKFLPLPTWVSDIVHFFS